MKRSIILAVAVCLIASSAFAQKRVALIRNDAAGDYATHDGNIVAALGTAGLNIGGTNIPGLGYTIIEYQAGSEPDPIDSSIADVIIISQTISSGTALPHQDDPTPLINTEQALNDDNGTPCDMYFSEGAGARAGATTINILDGTHPITSLWGTGQLQIFNSGELGVMTGALAGAGAYLAENAAVPGEMCISVAEAGGTPFLAGMPAGGDPAPARRMNLGFHLGAMADPTAEGVYLFQRAVQYMIGDPVTAGAGSIPDADVVRTITEQYTPGGQVTITLTATPLAPTAFDITETLPGGWTVVSASPSAGTATPSGNTVNWTGNLNATAETLTYVAQAPGTACGDATVTGEVLAGNTSPAPVGGDSTIAQVSDSLSAAPIPWAADVDIPTTMTPTGRTDYYNCDGSYMVWGAGTDIWNNQDEFHFLYVMANGNCAAVADVEHLDPEVNGWEKAGVMIRANLTQGSPQVMCVVRSSNENIYAQERVDQDGGSQRFTGIGSDLANFPASSEMDNNGVGRVFIARNGSAIVTGGDDLEGNDWITQQWLTADRPNLAADPVYVGLCFTSHTSGTIERARYTNVSITADSFVSTTPSDPSNLTAQAWGSGGIRLDWTDNSNNEDGFKIERKEGAAGTYAEIAQTGPNATLFIDSGLTVGTEYFYRIRAFNLSGDSGYSNEASAIPVTVLGAGEWPLYK